MAASPWQVMGPANKKIRVFHPGIDQEIEEIRRPLFAGLFKNHRQRNQRTLFEAIHPHSGGVRW